MKVKMIFPTLTEAKSPFWRPIKPRFPSLESHGPRACGQKQIAALKLCRRLEKFEPLMWLGYPGKASRRFVARPEDNPDGIW